MRPRPDARTRLGLALAVCVLAQAAAGQQLPLRVLGPGEGLAHERVLRIVRDRQGFLWFCTADGLSRYDGGRFRNYGAEDGLPLAVINDLLETRAGDHWVATNGGGVARLVAPQARRPGLRGFEAWPVGTAAASNRVNVLYEDRAGGVWAGTDAGLYLLLHGSAGFERVPLGFGSEDVSVQVWSLLEHPAGGLWLGTSRGLVRRGVDGRCQSHTLGAARPNHVWALALDGAGLLWAGCQTGLAVLWPQGGEHAEPFHWLPSSAFAGREPATERVVALPRSPGEARFLTLGSRAEESAVRALRLTPQALLVATSGLGLGRLSEGRLRFSGRGQGLPAQPLTSLELDEGGHVWLGTEGAGALRLAQSGFLAYGQAQGLGDQAVVDITETEGVPLVTTADERVHRLDGLAFRDVRLPVPPPHARRSRVPRPLVDHLGDWWLPTDSGLYRFAPVRPERLSGARPKAVYRAREGLADDGAFLAFEDSAGDVWVAPLAFDAEAPVARYRRATERFERFGAAQGLPARTRISAISEGPPGTVWLRFFDGHLARYQNEHFLVLRSAVQPAPSVGPWRDAAGRVWVVPPQGGLARLLDPSGERPRVEQVLPGSRLPSSRVTALVGDEVGRLYVGTMRGVTRFDPATGALRPYDVEDGLPAGEVLCALRTRDGSLWLGTRRGLARLQPAPERAPVAPRVRIGGLRVAGLERPLSELGEAWVGNLVLDADQHNLQVDYFAIDFGPGEAVYRHRLAGTGEWSAPSGERSVSYAGLGPGRYRFEVEALNASGLASRAPAVLTFHVLAPFWRRPEFGALVLALLAAAGFALHRQRVARLLALQRVRERIATDLHDDVGAGLSQIALLAEVARRRAAAADQPLLDALEKIAEAARGLVSAMSDMVWAIDPERDSLQDLVQRMRRYASDVLSARDIAFHFAVPAEALALPADVRRELYLIFKEAISNLARHSGCRSARLELRNDADALTLLVEDDGRGFDPGAPSDGHGLASLRRRAARLGAELAIDTRPGAGTRLLLRLPRGRS